MKNILISFLDQKNMDGAHSLFTCFPSEFQAGGFNFFSRDLVAGTRRKDIATSLFHGEIFIGAASGGYSQYVESLSGNRLTMFFTFLEKSWQLDQLQRTALSLGLKRYRFPMFSGTLHLTELDKKKRYLIKPEDQANGEMQFLMDTDKISLRNIIAALNNHDLRKIYDAGIKFSYGAAAQADMTAEEHDKKHQKFFDDFTGGANDFMVMEMLENVCAEYRIITNHHGDPIVVVKRNIVETNAGFKQATGITGGVPIALEPGVELHKAIRCSAEVTRLIKAMNTPFCGYDLFLCKDGTFGFFEFGIGWGMNNVPYQPLIDSMREFYVDCAKRITAHISQR